jgi:hypothetical protein
VRYGAPDVDPASSYTVKEYFSEKVFDADEESRHTRVELRPRSRNPEHKPIVMTPADEGEVRVIAEFVEVVG